MNSISVRMGAQVSTLSSLIVCRVPLFYFYSLLIYFFIVQKSKPKPQKGAFNRFARIPRRQLLNMLFSCTVSSHDRWQRICVLGLNSLRLIRKRFLQVQLNSILKILKLSTLSELSPESACETYHQQGAAGVARRA